MPLRGRMDAWPRMAWACRSGAVPAGLRALAVLLATSAWLAAAPPARAAQPLDLAGADALAASQGGGGMLERWAARASLAELLYVLRRSPAELGSGHATLIEAALKKTGGERRALRSRLIARLALVSGGGARKRIEELAGGGDLPPRPHASVFRVAALLPGSGDYAGYGRSVRMGLGVGLAEARSADSPPIELLYWSTGEDNPGRTAAALDSALETCGIVVGELLSVPTLSVATGSRIARAVLVSPTATDEGIGAVGSAVFQIGPSSARRAAALARAVRDWTPRGVGVLLSTESAQGGLGDRFAVAAESLGLKVVWRDSYAPGEQDFRSAVNAMANRKVDLMFFDGDPREADAMLRELTRDRFAVKLCGGEGLSPDQYHTDTRAMLEGARHVSPDWQLPPRVMARLDSVARAAGEEHGGPLHVRGYLAGRFIAAAVRQGALCPEEVATALAAKIERAEGDPARRFLDCAAEGAVLPVYSVSRGRSTTGPTADR